MKCMRVMDLMNACFPLNKFEFNLILSLVEEAYKLTDEDYGVSEAVDWAEGFEFPSDIAVRDQLRLSAHNHDLQKMVKALHNLPSEHRLTLARVKNSVPETDPDHDRLCSLAQGIIVQVDQHFIPNRSPRPLRKLYNRVAPAVNKMMFDLWKSDEIFILPTEEVRLLPGIHFSPMHWTTKHGKRQGRPLTDCSDGDPPLNSDAVRVLMRNTYGDIEHPNLDILINMILSEAEFDISSQSYNFSHLTLWKEDLASAFSLLNFSPESVCLMACELTEGLTMLYHTGSFGWTGTPFAFQVVTRTFKRLLNDGRLRGKADMYVDDVLGVSKTVDVYLDSNTTKTTAHSLLGAKSISLPKGEKKRRIVWLGWCIDLDQKLVSISRKNFFKALYLFFDIDTESQVQVVQLERLASISSRNSEVIRIMRPYTAALYNETIGMKSHHAFKPWKQTGKLAVWMWRVALCLLHLDENTYARSLSSFRFEYPNTTIEYDASLSAVGIIVTTPDKKRYAGKFVFPFNLDQQSKYQNCVEFIAVVAGILFLIQQGYEGCRLKLIGDSVSSLKWGQSERFKGVLGQKAAIAFILLGTNFNIEVVDTTHISGTQNVACDQLSRDAEPSDLGFGWEDRVKWTSQSSEILSMLDPSVQIETEQQLTQFWRQLILNIEDLKKK